VPNASANAESPDELINRGKALCEAGDTAEAIACFEKGRAQRPQDVGIASALAVGLWAAGRFAEAHAALVCALELAPNDGGLLLNLGALLYDEGRIDEALAVFDEALRLAPDDGMVLWRKSFALLAKGEYQQGWKLYASALGGPGPRRNRFSPAKLWNGGLMPGGRLLLWCEQGLGDCLQFMRYAELCKQRVGRVSVFCPKPLIRLFQSLPFIEEVSDICDEKNFDAHAPLMNLPHLFGATLETVPAAIPYLHVDPGIQARWDKKFAGDTDALKVGLVWAGGVRKGDMRAKILERQRDIKFEQMKPWLAIEGVKFYNLQKDGAASPELTDFMSEVVDFADTAALVQNLDLIIGVDTAVVHLAGALGKPVWILSRFNADWRWLQNRPENPWYPSAQIFGQPAPGDWGGVIKQVSSALADYAVLASNRTKPIVLMKK
jgi:hypothetical protein